MLLNCKPGCVGKKGTTTGSVDLETDEVVCDFCGDIIQASSFAKQAMKRAGEIVKPKKTSFQFDCLVCEKTKEIEIKNGEPKGKGCTNNCKFNVSKFTIKAIETIKAGVKNSDE